MSANEPWVPRVNPWLIAVSVMLATFMEVLDTSIANVALPYIAGTLSASNSEATWVLTSYLVSNAIILPASAWLGIRFGRTRFLTACIALFTAASMLCGAATNLGFLIVARVLQGVGGGALQPMAQAIMVESFPPQKRGAALAFYGVGVVVAPILGPTLGGWLTDNFSWRWIFYVNLPFGILAYFMIRTFVEDPPYIRDAKPGTLDKVGLGLLTVWLATLQIVLDKGQEMDWFSTPWIVWFSIVSVVSLIALVLWEMRTAHPLVDFSVLKDRNLAAATTLITALGVVFYATSTLLPLYLQSLMGYPALQSGLAVGPRGVGSVVGMIVIGRLVGVLDPRMLIALGFLGIAGSSLMLSNLTPDLAAVNVMVPNVINGFSIAFIFVPLSALATASLARERIGQGTGIYNLMRNLGASVGISMSATILERVGQVHQNELVRHLTPYDPSYTSTLQQFQTALGGTVTATQQALGLMYSTLQQQASLMAYVSTFEIMMYLSLAVIPLVLLLQKVNLKGVQVAAH